MHRKTIFEESASRRLLQNTDAVILCGGKGKRLKSISGDLPKSLMLVAGRPFLDILIENLLRQGFERIILSIGHGRERIREHVGVAGYSVEFSEEEMPLGTGGAVKRAATLIRSSSFLVMNGDSFCSIRMDFFREFHATKGGILSLAVCPARSGQDYGVLDVDADQRILGFREKNICREGDFINGGVYLMRRDIFSIMPDRDIFSLEYDLFPNMLAYGCFAFQTGSNLLDIGTPERLKKADKILKDIMKSDR